MSAPGISRFLFALLLATASCAGVDSGSTQRVETPTFVSEDGSYRLELPLGWKRSGQALTRDGWEQQTISFNAGRVKEPDDGQAIDASAPGFFQALEEELRTQTGVEVLECGPQQLDGLEGFRMHFMRGAQPAGDAGRAADSKREYLTCGVLADDMLFVFSYEAPAGDSFARDLPTFERMVQSFRHSAPPPGTREQ